MQDTYRFSNLYDMTTHTRHLRAEVIELKAELKRISNIIGRPVGVVKDAPLHEKVEAAKADWKWQWNQMYGELSRTKSTMLIIQKAINSYEQGKPV